MSEKVTKTEQEWREKLTPEAYRVARLGGTERPFTGEHLERTDKGDYLCICCGTLLFHSDAKVECGTGWPAFDEAVPGTIDRIPDHSHGMVRTEVRCSKCDAHLGHVFDDSRKKTGERYCINSVCIGFKSKQ
jgi:methionine-R-sulfoxide reductase